MEKTKKEKKDINKVPLWTIILYATMFIVSLLRYMDEYPFLIVFGTAVLYIQFSILYLFDSKSNTDKKDRGI